jgi:metal-responsive CopG/Arc/MetJ family transcriptional regulator
MANTKTAISLDETLFEQVDDMAREMNISRSRLFALAVGAYIEQHQNRKLLEALNEAYQDGLDPSEQELMLKSRAKSRQLLEGEW